MQAQINPAPFAPRPQENYAHTTLRGLAALCVVAFHAVRVPEPLPHGLGSFLQQAYLFVDLFFILSGFIMVETYAAFLQKGSRLRQSIRFYRRRASKILPNYYAWLMIGVLLTIALAELFGTRPQTAACLLQSLGTHLLLVQHFVPTCTYFNIPLWSIATEMFVYLLFPVLVLVLRQWWLGVLVALSCYVGMFLTFGTLDLIDGLPSLWRTFAGFVFGMAIASLPRTVLTAQLGLWQGVALSGVILAVLFRQDFLAVAAMAFLVFVTARDMGWMARVSRLPLLYVIGRASFSIYLAHIPVRTVMLMVCVKIEVETGLPLGSDWRLLMPINIVASTVVGLAAYHFIEYRCDTLLRRRKQEQIVVTTHDA